MQFYFAYEAMERDNAFSPPVMEMGRRAFEAGAIMVAVGGNSAAAFWTMEEADRFRTYTDATDPIKSMIFPQDPEKNRTPTPSDLVRDWDKNAGQERIFKSLPDVVDAFMPTGARGKENEEKNIKAEEVNGQSGTYTIGEASYTVLGSVVYKGLASDGGAVTLAFSQDIPGNISQ